MFQKIFSPEYKLTYRPATLRSNQEIEDTSDIRSDMRK